MKSLLLYLGLFGTTAPLWATPPAPLPAFRHAGQGEVFYFLLTDRFANGNPDNDRAFLDGDRERHGFEPTSKAYYHGGDFAGLTGRLDYLQQLGVSALWITPPFRNQYVQRGSAGYHGYWILDFLAIDPHLGTDGEFRHFLEAAHARGLKVFVDIVANHTADVIQYSDSNYAYRPTSSQPWTDATGASIELPASAPAPGALFREPQPVAPAVVPPALAGAKQPAWLNDVRYYHNRGDSTFRGESSLYGDFSGLDGLMTEHPDVVRGLSDIYVYWMREYKIDGYRIDTVKHVNPGFWQQFAPTLRSAARNLGRPTFFHFGEAMTADGRFLGDYTTETTLDATLDFALWKAARRYFSQGEPASVIHQLWDDDDYLLRPQGNAQLQATFIGNHDDGRFLYFLRRDRPNASPDELLGLSRLAHAFLLLARGQPILYYGDEQGMNGYGDDQMAREDMFPSVALEYRDLPLVGTDRRGRDDKFDPQHPLFRSFAANIALRRSHPALSRGLTLPAVANHPAVLGFSRFDREDLREYLVLFNRSGDAVTTQVQTHQGEGTTWTTLSADPLTTLNAQTRGEVTATLPAYGYGVWRAEAPLRPLTTPPRLEVITPRQGTKLAIPFVEREAHRFPERVEIRAQISGGDDVGEVTFTATRASRPNQTELLGVDDAPPYRVFWRPNPDWQTGDTIVFHATYSSLRGQAASGSSTPREVEGTGPFGGVPGAQTPQLVSLSFHRNERALTALARGSEPLFFQWYLNNHPLTVDGPILRVPTASSGTYRLVVHNQAGAVVSDPIEVP